MLFEFSCPHCKKVSNVNRNRLGTSGKCVRCGNKITIHDSLAGPDIPVPQKEPLTTKSSKTRRQFLSRKREPPIDQLVEAIGSRVQRVVDGSVNEESFALADAVQNISHRKKDLSFAIPQVYVRYMKWVLSKGATSIEQKRETAKTVARLLEMPHSQVEDINLAQAKLAFDSSLSLPINFEQTVRGCVKSLEEIASVVGESLKSFVRRFAFEKSEEFLENVFASCIVDSDLSLKKWGKLLSISEELGFTRDEMLQAIKPQAWRFATRLATDARADGFLDDKQKSVFLWMVDNLKISVEFLTHIVREFDVLQQLTDLENGTLPILEAASHRHLKPGEVVHFFGQAKWFQTKAGRRGEYSTLHKGDVLLTNKNIQFAAVTLSFSIPHKDIIDIQGGGDIIRVLVNGKPGSVFRFTDSSQLPLAILNAAVTKVNQRINDHQRKRGKIPDDVKNRVWERCDHKCVQCGAESPLHFDHIIPFSKGGGDQEENLQILCQTCNLKKSDKI